jgi:Holliday junction resolvase
MRRAARIDANQPEIVEALRKAGCSVQILSAVGHGCPDIAVGRGAFNYLLEIKDGSKPPSARLLTNDELAWHVQWKGSASVVYDVPSALKAVGL